MRLRYWVSLLLLLLLSGLQCKPGEEKPVSRVARIKIGVAGPFSGRLAPDAEAIRRGVELAVDEVNRRGGINGVKVEVLTVDDRGDPKTAAKVAEVLANDPEVLAVVGHYNSSCTIAAAPIYNRAELVSCSPASTSPRITGCGEYTFRVCPSDELQGRLLARYAVKDMGRRRIAIIYDDDDYGNGLKYFFSSEASRLGARIVAKVPYPKGASPSSLLAQVRGANPDLLFVACVMAPAADLCLAASSARLGVPILGGDGMISDEFRRRAGDACEGVTHALFFHPSLAQAKEFVTNYQYRYREIPGGWAALAYEAAQVIIRSLEEGGLTRQGVRGYMAEIGNTRPKVSGVSGDIGFDAQGDVAREILIGRIRMGRVELVETELGG